MGMRDESWCNDCGEGITFTEDEEALCGECATDRGIEMIESIIRYIENQKNEFEHRLELADGADSVYHYLEGCVETSDLFLHKVKDLYQNGF